MTVPTFVARYDTTCPGCGGVLAAGMTGGFVAAHKAAVCAECLSVPAEPLVASLPTPRLPVEQMPPTADSSGHALMPHQVAGLRWLHEHPAPSWPTHPVSARRSRPAHT